MVFLRAENNVAFAIFPFLPYSTSQLYGTPFEVRSDFGHDKQDIIPRKSWVSCSEYGPGVALPRHGAVLGCRGNFEQKRRHLVLHFSHVATPGFVYVNGGLLTCRRVCGLTVGSAVTMPRTGVLIIILDGGNKDVVCGGLCMMM